MKNNFIFLAITMFLASGFVFAQTGGVYVNPQTMNSWNNPISSYLDTVITNQNNANFYNNQLIAQMLYNKSLLNNLKIKYGNERIAKKQASTRFVPLSKNSFINQSANRISDSQERQKFLEANRQMLQTFEIAMKANGFTPNDLAEARSLAFVIAYQILNDEFPGKQRLQNLAGSTKNIMLKDAFFQGTPDEEKQYEYEQIGIQAILATYSANLARKDGLTDSERIQAENTAKKNAENLLARTSNIPPGAIEMTADGFGNKAERLIKEGEGSTTFKRSTEIVTQTRSIEEKNLYKEFISKFDAEVKKRGGQINDLAYANAVAFDLAFKVANNGKLLNTNQFKWILNEMIQDITSAEQANSFQSLTEIQKQEGYESLAVRSMRLVTDFNKLVESSKKKQTDYFEAIAQASENSSKKRNLEFDSWKLMRSVFQPRKLDDYELIENGFRKIR